MPIDPLPVSPTSTGDDAVAAYLRRLRWQCRRGMRELDVVLQRYLDQRYSLAPAAERQAFEALLDLQDPQLFSYLTGRDSPTDTELVNVIARLANTGS